MASEISGAGAYAPAPPLVARELFGDRLELAVRYANELASAGVERGLIGPRERERLWDRHLVNCALIEELLPTGARVVDIGSGAGLPGLALACCRADLSVDLVEPLRRRSVFLQECVEMLGLSGAVRVIPGRAEALAVVQEVGAAQWVTARAVAPLEQLCRWCLPLLAPTGRLLALKGERAEQEVTEQRDELRRLGAIVQEVVRCGVGRADPPTTVVVVSRG